MTDHWHQYRRINHIKLLEEPSAQEGARNKHSHERGHRVDDAVPPVRKSQPSQTRLRDGITVTNAEPAFVPEAPLLLHHHPPTSQGGRAHWNSGVQGRSPAGEASRVVEGLRLQGTSGVQGQRPCEAANEARFGWLARLHINRQPNSPPVSAGVTPAPPGGGLRAES